MNQCQYKDDKGNNQIYDKAFILLDGSVDFLIDLFDPQYQDKSLIKICKNINLDFKKVHKEVNDYKIQHEISDG